MEVVIECDIPGGGGGRQNGGDIGRGPLPCFVLSRLFSFHS